MSSIKLDNVCLDYIIKTGSDSIKKTAIILCNAVLSKNKKNLKSVNNSSFRALNNINLTINKNDRVGLLGRNGAGKSSLLRVLAKVYKPSSGSIMIDGEISSLFDVCLGMDAESTGYENIFQLSIMRGLSKKTAHDIISDIEEFTELGNFLNVPVRTYSAGMMMKLAFAVATAIPPEIMLIDEVIGAGDAHFMKKATNRMINMVDSSHILVITSHSNDIIRQFCNKTVVLEKGEIKFCGTTEEGIDFYKTEIAKALV